MSSVFCPICYDSVDVLHQHLESVVGCGHVFHGGCLQEWVRLSPVSPTCPLCKARCGERERQRLFFQASSESSQRSSPTTLSPSDPLSCEKGEEYVRSLEAKERALQASLDSARRRISVLQDGEQENKAKLNQIGEIARLANLQQSVTEEKLKRVEKELNDCERDRKILRKRMATLEQDLASNQLINDVEISEDEVIQLASSGHLSKDEYIQMLARALLSRNQSFKDLMKKCNEFRMEEFVAKKHASKLEAKLANAQARIKGSVHDQEILQNDCVRSLQARVKNMAHEREAQLEPLEQVQKGQDHDILRPLKDVHTGLTEVPRERKENEKVGTHIETPNNFGMTGPEDDQVVNLGCGLPIPIRRERNSSLVEESNIHPTLFSGSTPGKEIEACCSKDRGFFWKNLSRSKYLQDFTLEKDNGKILVFQE
ncbi:hypothetical protein Mp_6g21380 [Marchantia polymorpha subsp. ruderalis]|uniref:RING-type domain-containing protein n=2 Tax=Marchantia polymorpha TaxID=3197 RepID=A0AAF6BUH7_MARPO|nr:hypothetical protein MARPO_0091s0017 [Marchantia polymorpha]BBN15661.1 hypothetical protein Mp_6g21380 [Marchantia polymorpha subsp. ruderalis]|eukprot:PTQ33152.1 hypothetical protein MARPO_0091s0017 [Marchantia polymorpha]